MQVNKNAYRMTHRVISLIAVIGLLTIANAQTASIRRQATTQSSAISGTLPIQQIGPDDLLTITTFDCPELSGTFRVSSDGTLALPLIGSRLKASNIYPVQLEDAIAEKLKTGQILVSPVVSVSVAEYRSRPINVVGAVRHPISFQAMGQTTLLDALAKAEGLSTDAGSEIIITRKSRTGTHEVAETIQRVSVRTLIESGNAAANVRLYGGEDIRVPENGKIFIVGNVKKPGSFPMQDNSDTTLLKALALSEGAMPYSSKLAFIYRRTIDSDKRTEIPVDLSSIIKRKSPDKVLVADDILYIPENRGKKLTSQTIERIAGFGTSTASGMLIWRR